ncbi:MAG TPA: prolipoprotein diacylglyceryl transferase family protein [Acidobacteriota bacterium]|nr:prolipoprotein diacylglyceryl transferase family protein [Acidobacteriota bacterium]
MKHGAKSFAAKSGYALLFMGIVPLFLVFWAFSTDARVSVPVPAPVGLEYPGILLGLGLMLSGTMALWKHGHGLPMNPFPPTHYVRVSMYRYLSHPLYIGFCLIVACASVIARSASGFWLVAPISILSCAALVCGYENHDLDERFGPQRARALVSLPANDESRPRKWDIASVYLLVFVPWLILYELAVMVGPASSSRSLALPWERHLPVVEWTEALYASTYIWSALTPLFAAKRKYLREFAISGLLLTAIGIMCFCLFPLVVPPRSFTPGTILGQLLAWERSHDTVAAAFPAFHLIWAMLSARLFMQSMPRFRIVWGIWAAAIAVSCITTGAHVISDLFAAFLLVLLVWRRDMLWTGLLSATEHLCNSWHEWRFGSLRIINHGVYAGLGALVGTLMVAALLPQTGAMPLLIMNLGGLLGGAMLAQALEGSSKLLRPFGYFGSIVGCAVALVFLWLSGAIDGWIFCAAFAIAAPVIQAFGRLRCLVQGCCHGQKTQLPSQGIRYCHPSSRVSRLAGMSGVPVYPTPLYSIVWNIVIALVLARLWFLTCSASLIVGLYFILIGLGRFVEESYRGEPQTLIVGRLRIYQWFCIGFLIVGAILTCISSPPAPGSLGWNWHLVPVAWICGLAAWAAMGVDFPASTRRFARLSG